MAKFIRLRLTQSSNYALAKEIHVRADAITSIRVSVEGDDWFKHNLNANETAPAAVVVIDGLGWLHTIETPEQILALINAA